MTALAPLELERGYAMARAVTRHHAKSFFFASALLFGARKRAAYALYAVCRLLDDVVDHAEAKDQRARLDESRAVLKSLFETQSVPPQTGPFPREVLIAFLDTVQRFKLDFHPLDELIAGMEMDLTIHRYQSWDQLELYCYRAAGTVGELMAKILGPVGPAAMGAAIQLGKAMQLTNILRDVKEDLAMGRIYLPAQEMNAFGVTEQSLREGKVDVAFRALVAHQARRARQLYAEGATGVPALRTWGARATVRVMSTVYGGILEVIEALGYDVFAGRASVSKGRKFLLALKALAFGAPVALLPVGVVR